MGEDAMIAFKYAIGNMVSLLQENPILKRSDFERNSNLPRWEGEASDF